MTKPNSVSWMAEIHGPYRIGRSYCKSAAHQKMPPERKEKIEEKKRWKKRKNKNKYLHQWYYGGTARGYCLNRGQRALRRWYKQEIHHERYDDIPTCYPSHMFYDPWDWD